MPGACPPAVRRGGASSEGRVIGLLPSPPLERRRPASRRSSPRWWGCGGRTGGLPPLVAQGPAPALPLLRAFPPHHLFLPPCRGRRGFPLASSAKAVLGSGTPLGFRPASCPSLFPGQRGRTAGVPLTCLWGGRQGFGAGGEEGRKKERGPLRHGSSEFTCGVASLQLCTLVCYSRTGAVLPYAGAATLRVLSRFYALRET